MARRRTTPGDLNRLVVLVADRSLTITTLAERLGMHKSTVGQLVGKLRDEGRITLATADRLLPRTKALRERVTAPPTEPPIVRAPSRQAAARMGACSVGDCEDHTEVVISEDFRLCRTHGHRVQEELAIALTEAARLRRAFNTHPVMPYQP